MVTLMKVDGTQEEVGDKIDLQTAQKLVGGYVEVVCANHHGLKFLVDEEGRMKGKQWNEKISIMIGHPIVGDVLMLTGNSRNGW